MFGRGNMAGPAEGGAANARYGTATLALSGLMMLLIGINLGKALTGGSGGSERLSTRVDVHAALQEVRAQE